MKKPRNRLKSGLIVPKMLCFKGLNDFESGASANSTTPASDYRLTYLPQNSKRFDLFSQNFAKNESNLGQIRVLYDLHVFDKKQLYPNRTQIQSESIAKFVFRHHNTYKVCSTLRLMELFCRAHNHTVHWRLFGILSRPALP